MIARNLHVCGTEGETSSSSTCSTNQMNWQCQGSASSVRGVIFNVIWLTGESMGCDEHPDEVISSKELTFVSQSCSNSRV